MFKHITATVPLYVSETDNVLHGDLNVNLDSGRVILAFDSEMSAYHLVMMIRMNNLLGVTLTYDPLREEKTPLPPKTRGEFGDRGEDLVHKLDDTGIHEEHARAWVREVIAEAHPTRDDVKVKLAAEAKSLLSKYIDHVASCEGVDFLSDVYRSRSAECGDVTFTDEEWAALKNL